MTIPWKITELFKDHKTLKPDTALTIFFCTLARNTLIAFTFQKSFFFVLFCFQSEELCLAISSAQHFVLSLETLCCLRSCKHSREVYNKIKLTLSKVPSLSMRHYGILLWKLQACPENGRPVLRVMLSWSLYIADGWVKLDADFSDLVWYQALCAHAHPLASLTPAGVTSDLGRDITNLRDLRCAAVEGVFLQPVCVRLSHTSPRKGHDVGCGILLCGL